MRLSANVGEPLLWSIVLIVTALCLFVAAALLRRHRLHILRAASESWFHWIHVNRADAAAVAAGCVHYDNAVLAYEIVRQLPLSRWVCRRWPHLAWSSQLVAGPNPAAVHASPPAPSPPAVPLRGPALAPSYPLPVRQPTPVAPRVPQQSPFDGGQAIR